MLRIELIYDLDCPNVQRAREALFQALGEAGLPPSWTEWERKSPASPEHVRRYGSPTILVEGRDVAGAQPGEGLDSCRLYHQGAAGLQGVPAVADLAAALRSAVASAPARTQGSGRRWWPFLASVPGVGATLLPVGLCPACWPAYAGLLGSLGLGFVFESSFLLPVTIGSLGLALFALALRARTRRGYGPLLLGLASVGSVLGFRFGYPFDPLLYAGLLGLAAASAWNAWPRRKREVGFCSACVQQEGATEMKNLS